MQIVSNYLCGSPGVTSPWSAWQMLFHRDEGDEAVIFTGYLSGGTTENGWRDDIIEDIVRWLTYKRRNELHRRRLSVFVGSWNDVSTYNRTVTMLARLLANIGRENRKFVTIGEIPSLHIKASAVFNTESGSAQCIRLLTGSSNLTHSTMAAGNNIELDAYFCSKIDGAKILNEYGRALSEVKAKCIVSMQNQAPAVGTILADEPLVARFVYSSSDGRKFYDDVEREMFDIETELESSRARTKQREMNEASEECLRSDTNS